MDTSAIQQYLGTMRKFASCFVVMLIVVFSASTILHAASANAMTVGGAMTMIDCPDCPADGDGDSVMDCELACMAPVICVLKGAESSGLAAPLLLHDRPLGLELPRGLRTPPDPFPPRTLI